jgi:hypothetical protein
MNIADNASSVHKTDRRRAESIDPLANVAANIGTNLVVSA